MTLNTYTSPDLVQVLGRLAVQTAYTPGDSYTTLDDGLISTSGHGDLIVRSLTTQTSATVPPPSSGDAAVAINAALASVAATGGTVLLQPGVYKTQSSILIPADNVHLVGAGFATSIQPVAGSSFDVIATAIPSVAGASGFVQNFISVEHLLIDGSLMAGTVAGQGNLIHFYGVRYSRIHQVFFTNAPNWAILLDGDNTGPGNNFSYDIYVTECVFDLGNGGIRCSNSEANQLRSNQFKWCGSACTAAQPAFGTQITTSNHMRMDSGYMFIVNNVVGNGGTTTQPQILLSNNGPCKIIGNRSDQARYQFVTANGGNHLIALNQVGSFAKSSGGTVPGIQLGSSGNLVLGNEFDITAGATGGTYNIAESGGPFTGNRIIGNDVRNGGSLGRISLNAASTAQVRDNAGYNPVGNITAPAVPATTVPRTNTFGVDMLVCVTANGATISAIAIGGVATGLTSGAFLVPANQTITLTYTVATPAWTWFGV
jgi:hypothetical protein